MVMNFDDSQRSKSKSRVNSEFALSMTVNHMKIDFDNLHVGIIHNSYRRFNIHFRNSRIVVGPPARET